MASSLSTWRRRFEPGRQTARWAFLLVNLELAILWLWLLGTRPQFTSVAGFRYVVYPFIWINVGLWVLVRSSAAPTSSRRRHFAGALAAGYFLVLAYAGGLFGPATGSSIPLKLAFGTPPGFSPTLLYDGAVLKLTVFPYKLIGYVALAYLVYATIIDAAGSAISGVIGLFSCVSCSWPVLASLLTGALGGGAALVSSTYAYSYDISLVVFLLTVGLLYWRPTVR